MNHSQASHEETIRGIIHQVNACWQSRRYEEIHDFIADDVVVAPPGSDDRIRGRDAFVQSYRDYDSVAVTQEFSPEIPRIDVLDDVAIAVNPFYVVYELQGKTYRENGRELLVFSRAGESWRIIWRTVQSQPAE